MSYLSSASSETRRGVRLGLVPEPEVVDDLSIESLLRDVAEGDRAAFAQVYDRIS
jgi:hypothetical protein